MTALTLRFQRTNVHHLVVFSFLGPPVSHQQRFVSHKDLDKGNNAVEHLEYVTHAENMVHCYVHNDMLPRSDAKSVETRCRGSTSKVQLIRLT